MKKLIFVELLVPVIFLPSLFGFPSSEYDCWPMLNEFNFFGFRSTQQSIFYELSLNPGCDRSSPNTFNLNNFGLIVLDSKSYSKKDSDYFSKLAFVDFNNRRWSVSNNKLDDYYVVGSTGEEGMKHKFNWNFYDDSKSTSKPSRFVNWRHCLTGVAEEKQSQSVAKYCTQPSEKKGASSQIIFLIVHLNGIEESREFVKRFSFIETTSSNNVKSVENIHVTFEDMEWIKARFVHVTHYASHENMLPLERLRRILKDDGYPLVYVLTENIDSGMSVSRCADRYALTAWTPGEDNACDVADRNMQYLDMRTLSSLAQPPSSPSNDEPIDVDGTNHDSFQDVPYNEPMPPIIEVQHHCDCQKMAQLREQQDKMNQQMLSLQKIVKDGFNTIQTEQKKKEISDRDRFIAQEEYMSEISNFLREKNILIDNEVLQGTVEEARKFGLSRSKGDILRLRDNLSKLSIADLKLSDSQIHKIMSYQWISYYRDSNRPHAHFFRCNLCNRHHLVDYDPQTHFDECQAQHLNTNSGPDKKFNVLGEGKVMCVSRYSRHAKASLGVTRILERIQSHNQSKEHVDVFRLFQDAVSNVQHTSKGATATTVLAAYTIAKEGLSFSKQFPLLLLAMKTGAVAPEAHYDPTTAARMIKQFALHMKYDMFRYIIDNNLPFSLLADGSSNNGVKWIVFLIRTLSPKNRPITFHLGLVEVEHENAKEIVNAFTDHLKSFDEWVHDEGLRESPYKYAMKHMIALSSDGASVMVGSVTGVYTRLKNLIIEETIEEDNSRTDFIISICSAHKLNLAVTSLRGHAINLTQSIIMEMHHLFGSTLRTHGTNIYNHVASEMSFTPLQMGALHPVRWSASLYEALSKILRNYPVLVESLNRLAKDTGASAKMRIRAKIASWVLEDGRTFIILQHVNATLFHLSSLSKALQSEDGLLVDYLAHWRRILHLFNERTIRKYVEQYLVNDGILKMKKKLEPRFSKMDLDFLRNYYASSMEKGFSSENANSLIAYNPKRFKGHRKHPVAGPQQQGDSLLDVQLFRDLNPTDSTRGVAFDDTDRDLEYHMEDAPDFEISMLQSLVLGKVYKKAFGAQKASTHITEFYEELSYGIKGYMTPNQKEVELGDDFPYALDRHVILDIIQCGGDFLYFNDHCAPTDANSKNRGYPKYMEKGTIDKFQRKLSIQSSIRAIKRYCNINAVESAFHSFYDGISQAARNLNAWPKDLRDDRTSVRFFQQLLNNADSLNIPFMVKEAIQCFLVIPASNADPERSFSAANRLTRYERSRLGTKTLDNLMTIERDGPSVLTVSATQLTQVWLKPLPFLKLPMGKDSSTASGGTLMKDVSNAFRKGDNDKLIDLQVQRDMIVYRENQRDDRNAIIEERDNIQRSRATIYSIGVLYPERLH